MACAAPLPTFSTVDRPAGLPGLTGTPLHWKCGWARIETTRAVRPSHAPSLARRDRDRLDAGAGAGPGGRILLPHHFRRRIDAQAAALHAQLGHVRPPNRLRLR